MFHIKICGVRLKQDLQAVQAAGGDAVGLNFFAPSLRYLDPSLESTRRLAQTAAELGLVRVGVFVNESPEQIARVVDSVGLDAIQLHGDETLPEAAAVTSAVGLKVQRLRAIKLPITALAVDQIQAQTAGWIDAGFDLLFDADAGAAQGGSGKSLHWPSLAAWSAANEHVRWTLAGGLTPSNVAAAIASSSARSVDTASGVESPKGIKSAERIKQFIEAAKMSRRR